MLRSLWFRLVGAFAAVIVVMLVVVTAAVYTATARQFDLYTTQRGRIWADQLAPVLAEQYALSGDWRDAQAILADPWLPPTGLPGSGRRMMGEGHMSGMMAGGMWGMMGFRLLLADTQGIVMADTDNALHGQSLTAEALAQGTPVIVEGQQVGTLLVVNPRAESPSRRSFLSAVNRAALLAAVTAGGFALVMGTLLFLRITRPLRQLQQAAQTVAAGDLETRVRIASKDELGAVGQAFNQMAARLDEQQRLRKQMVADIAHELRTPISVMQGTLEAMLDGVLQPDPAELRDLHGETRRLARLIEDLRILSLADAGQLTLERRPVNLAALIERVVGRMAPLAESRQIALATAINEPLLSIEADEDRLAQVLTNLIDNALRYTPSGGHVRVQARQADGALHVAVADDGPGIAAEDAPYVFERFWRGDRSRSRHGGGSGIGLAIAKHLVEMHGGTIGVESEVGKGSTFRVRLPLR
jgi:two-component system OmpR family sensor kinase/two-component system sensor histidine kinase BaeS